jgi:hypothetical protein
MPERPVLCAPQQTILQVRNKQEWLLLLQPTLLELAALVGDREAAALRRG